MDPLSRATQALLGSAPVARTRLHGGDLSMVERVELASGEEVVAKRAPLVAREARMLEAMAQSGARTPRVLGVHGEVLLMEALGEVAPSHEGWLSLAETLSHLHGVNTAVAGDYGWAEDYAFGPVKIDNRLSDDWVTFWAQRRLLAGLGDLPADLARRLERLAGRLGEFIPKRPAPALLHGDLWAGNLLFTKAGCFLIDPACYRGHDEVDLAMLELFGGANRVLADRLGWPGAGWPGRRAVYQLWPVLVHLRLFGASYRGMVEARLAQLGA